MEQPATQDPLIGFKLNNYQVENKLGVGGMGSVYMAVHPLIGKKVALKVLHPEFVTNEDVIGRFFHEAKAVNDIQHPNIVDILDYGKLEHPGQTMVYFIMEYLDGPSLADLIRREAPLAPERALAIALQIADALSASHRKGIVHRDLKPDNVILIQRGRELDFVKVLDFGIAKLTGEGKGSMRTRTGIVMGTPAYMSPEQCEGRGNVDQRTDVYALGILLYEMLTGQVPFSGEGYGEILVKHLTQAPPPPSTIRGVIPPHVEAVVLRALAKRPEDRYPSMDEFMKALTDPVGYVESRGGISMFIGASMNSAFMPWAGSVMAGNPVYPSLTPTPGQISTLHATGPVRTMTAGELGSSGGRRILTIAAVAILVLGLAGGGYALMQNRKDVVSTATSPGAGTEPGTGQGADTSPAGTGTDRTAGQAAGDTGTGGTGGTAGNDQGDSTGTDNQGEAAGTGEDTKAVEATVTIKVISYPEGADVFVVGESESRGKTPLTFEMPKSEDKLAVVIQRDGYEDVKRDFVPNIAKEFEVQLRRDRRATRTKITNKPRDQTKRDPQQNKEKIKTDVELADPDWD